MKQKLQSKCQGLWARFKTWQRSAFDYSFDSNKEHTCENCENTFVGNYCPHCSQKAGVGKISWHTVRLGVMEVWGMHSRSMPYSLWQLMFRPGYMISEYINGKRQVSFPPVKMLVILGIISVLVDSLFVVDKRIIQFAPSNDDEFKFIVNFLTWLSAHPGWGWLFITCFMIIPTWAIFRYSPRNAKHSFPQGFFIQVFMSVQVLLVDDLADIISDVFYVMIPLCYMYTNRQLFGHNVWGTIWRTLLVLVSGVIIAFMAIYLYDVLTPAEGEDVFFNLMGVIILFVISLALIFAGVVFSKISWNRREKRNAEQTDAEQDKVAVQDEQPQLISSEKE